MMFIRLAWRSIWRNRRRTLITICSIGLGLMFAIFFISLGEGMYRQLIDQAVRMQSGYITLEHAGYQTAPSVDLFIQVDPKLRREIEHVKSVSQTKLLVLGQGIAKSGAGNLAGALMGVEPDREAAASPLAKNMIAGDYLNDQDGGLVVIGSEMARRLNLDIGKKLVLSANDIHGDLVEELCRVKGIFKTGSEEMDASVVQMPINFARKLFQMPGGGASRMAVILSEPARLKVDLARIKNIAASSPIEVLPWQEVLPDVASYIKMDRGSNLIFQAILIFLILFTIFNTLLMSVLERKREFAVLLAVGTGSRQLCFQLLMESIFIGLIGCGLGVFLGGLASYIVHILGIDLKQFIGEGVNISGFAMSTRLYTRLTARILFGTAALVLAATMVLSLVPMRRIGRLEIVDELRQEWPNRTRPDVQRRNTT